VRVGGRFFFWTHSSGVGLEIQDVVLARGLGEGGIQSKAGQADRVLGSGINLNLVLVGVAQSRPASAEKVVGVSARSIAGTALALVGAIETLNIDGDAGQVQTDHGLGRNIQAVVCAQKSTSDTSQNISRRNITGKLDLHDEEQKVKFQRPGASVGYATYLVDSFVPLA
jgi:hypothetical protein